MNALVVLLLLLGGFLIMDAVGEKRVARAEKEAKQTVKYVPLSIYDEQLSGRSLRDDFANMFASSGPWGFRDDFANGFDDRETPTDPAVAAERSKVDRMLADRFDRMASELEARPAEPRAEPFASIPETPAERRMERRRRRERRAGGRG